MIGSGYGEVPAVRWSGLRGDRAPVVVLLHGHGRDVEAVDDLAAAVPSGVAVAAVRGPLTAGPSGRGWFEAVRPGVPRRASLERTVSWLADRLRALVADGRRPVVVGHSAGGATAAALALRHPGLVGAVGLVHASVPRSDDVVPGRLAGLPTLLVHGASDRTLPAATLTRTWRYLHDWSGADVVGVRHDGGHELTPEVAETVGAWLRSLDLRGRDQDAAPPRNEPSRSHGPVHGARR